MVYQQNGKKINWCSYRHIRQSSTDSVTYIRTRMYMYRSSRFAFSRQILWCSRLCLPYRETHISNLESFQTSCADLEGESGGGRETPPGICILNIADITGNEKFSYFSYLCTSTVICQGWIPPPGKIFWIRACRACKCHFVSIFVW